MKVATKPTLADLTNPLEDDEQKDVVEFMELHNLKFTAVPNNTYTPYQSQKNKNAAMGLRAGFPDLIVIVNNIFICIEMKRRKGGVVSPMQKEWAIAINQTQVPSYICHGSDEAIQLLEEYMHGERK